MFSWDSNVYEAPDRDTEASCLSVVQKSSISYTEACQESCGSITASHFLMMVNVAFVWKAIMFANGQPLGDPPNDFDSHTLLLPRLSI